MGVLLTGFTGVCEEKDSRGESNLLNPYLKIKVKCHLSETSEKPCVWKQALDLYTHLQHH